MPYKRKTHDEFVLLCNYGYGDGWEEVNVETTWADAVRSRKEYRANMPEYPYKLVKRRVPIDPQLS